MMRLALGLRSVACLCMVACYHYGAQAAAFPRTRPMGLQSTLVDSTVMTNFETGSIILQLVDADKLSSTCKPSLDPLKQQLFECFRTMKLFVDEQQAELSFDKETSPEGMYCQIYTFQGHIQGSMLNFTKLVYNSKKVDEYYAQHSTIQENLLEAERLNVVEALVDDLVSAIMASVDGAEGGKKKRKLHNVELGPHVPAEGVATSFSGRKMQGIAVSIIPAEVVEGELEDEEAAAARNAGENIHPPMPDELKQRFAALVVTHALGVSTDAAQKLVAPRMSRGPPTNSRHGISGIAHQGMLAFNNLHRHKDSGVVDESDDLPTQPFSRLRTSTDVQVNSHSAASSSASSTASSSFSFSSSPRHHAPHDGVEIEGVRSRRHLSHVLEGDLKKTADKDAAIEAQMEQLQKRGDSDDVYQSAKTLWAAVQKEAVKRTVWRLQEEELLSEIEAVSQAETQAWERLGEVKRFMEDLSKYYDDLEAKQDELSAQLGALLDGEAKATAEEAALRNALDAILEFEVKKPDTQDGAAFRSTSQAVGVDTEYDPYYFEGPELETADGMQNVPANQAANQGSMLHVAMTEADNKQGVAGTTAEALHSYLFIDDGAVYWKFDSECTYKYQPKALNR